MLQAEEKIIALNLRSRPLRLAYLVTCLEDIENAISLYTHTWGGAANAILPVYDDEEKIKQLQKSLIKFDPDHILFTHERELSSNVKHILDNYPALNYSIHRKEIESFVKQEDNIYIRVGNLISFTQAKLPHIVSTLNSLYPNPVSNIDLNVVELFPSEFDLALSLQAGIITQTYQQGLIRHLGANVLKTPLNCEDLFKISLCLSTALNPALLTLENLRIEERGTFHRSGWLDEPLALCLFLYENDDLDIVTSFWNARWFYPSNKLLFPKQEFIDNVEHYANLALSAIPSLEAIQLAVNINNKYEAKELQNNIKYIFSKVAERNIAVRLTYRDFYQEVRKVAIYTNSPKISSQKIHSDDSIRFLPETPLGLKSNDFAFGYDVKLNLDSGSKLLFPRTPEISTLLSNSLIDIEDKFYEEQGISFPSLSIRATDIGIAGIGVTGKECKLYLHPDSVIISRYLNSIANIVIKANRHTRYAEGFIKSLGGLRKIYFLVNKGGVETLLALCSQKSEQSGQGTTSLIKFLRDKIKIDHKKAQSIINEQLPEFLASGLVKRGVALKCPICVLKSWYSISSLNEFIECQGCLEKFQLESIEKHEYSYVPNELSRRLIQNGGIAVLATASLFLIANPPSFIQFGGDLFESNQKNNFAEIDLIAIAGDILTIAECKYFPKLDSEEQVQKSLSSSTGLKKAIKIAERIGAKIVILGVSTNLENFDREIVQSLKHGVASLAETTKNKGIGVHLWLTGIGVDRDPYRNNNLTNLIPRNIQNEQKSIYERGVGELPFSSFGGMMKPFDDRVLKAWKSQQLLS